MMDYPVPARSGLPRRSSRCSWKHIVRCVREKTRSRQQRCRGGQQRDANPYKRATPQRTYSETTCARLVCRLFEVRSHPRPRPARGQGGRTTRLATGKVCANPNFPTSLVECQPHLKGAAFNCACQYLLCATHVSCLTAVISSTARLYRRCTRVTDE